MREQYTPPAIVHRGQLKQFTGSPVIFIVKKETPPDKWTPNDHGIAS